jgi:ATP adenylyltransferase
VPIEPLLAEGRTAEDGSGLGRDAQEGVQAPGQPLTLPALPFRTAFMKLSGLPPAAELADAYLALLDHAGIACRDTVVRGPYNLLLTDAWMLLVPRTRELYAGISINALGFAGALLVRNQAQMTLLRRVGPLEVLSQVGEPVT